MSWIQSFALIAIAFTFPVYLSGQTPTSPSAAVDVLDLVQRAKAKTAENQWHDAADLWARVVELNPVEPSHWYSLGIARENVKDYQAAITAYENAAELGAPDEGAYYSIFNVARCQALLGHKELAIESLHQAFWLGFPNHSQLANDPALASLRDDPRVVELLGLQDVSNLSRDEGWRYDLAILAREVVRKGFNPSLYVNRPVSAEQFDQEVKKVHDAIPKLTDGQVVLEFMKLMVFLQDGHSAVWDVGENPLFRAAIPLRLFWFEEGLFVTAADAPHKELLGAQLLAFDGRPTDEVLKAMEQFVNRDRHNPMCAKLGLPYRIRVLTMLHAAGLINAPDNVTLTIRDSSGLTREVKIASDEKEPSIWNKLPAPDSWTTFASTLQSAPLYVQHMDKPQWFQYLPEQKTVYFQFNKVLDDDKENLEEFSKRLLKFVDENEVDRLVIDMRWNNGGNTFLGHPLLLGLIGNKKVNQPGKLFVIIGRRTYSAAQNMATFFERYTHATFVGEPTGSSPNFVGEESPITLPYSKLMANVSNLFWQSSWPQDQRIWLAPQIFIPPTYADFRAGRDAALEAILALPRQ